MLLWCPSCSARHIDEGEYATKPHHTHACQHCGMVWRPAIGPTVGVAFLPGFRDKVEADRTHTGMNAQRRLEARLLARQLDAEEMRALQWLLAISVEDSRAGQRARDHLGDIIEAEARKFIEDEETARSRRGT